MSSIIFTLVGLDGEVVPFTSFKIEAAAPDGVYDPEYIVPAPVIITTDAEGVATVELEATTAPYFITRLSGTIDDFIALKFFVPASSIPIQAEMLYVDLAKHQKLHTDRALYALIETKVAMLHALNLFQLNQGLASVESVNGQTGVVVLDASDVGADVSGAAATAQAAAVQRANHTGTQLANTISDFSASASSAAPVQSVFGRTGAVTAQNGDYTAAQVGADAAGSAAAAQAAAVQRANHTGTQLAATISDFNATASAAAPVQSVNGNTGTVTVVQGDSRSNRQGSIFWCEDFIGNYSRCEFLRQPGVSNIAELNGENVSAAGLTDGRGVFGFVPSANTFHITLSTLQSGASGINVGGTKKTNLVGCSAVSQLTSMAIAVLPTAPGTSGYELYGGFVTTSSGYPEPTAAEALYWAMTDSGIALTTATGGSATTSAWVPFVTAGIAVGARLNIRLDWTSADVKLYVNNVLVVINSTHIPQNYCGPLAVAFRSSTGTQSNFANLWTYLDYIDQVFTVSTPRVLV